MRRIFLILVAVGALAAPGAADAATRAVMIRATGFAPAQITITAGDRIVWRNADTRSHQVVSDVGAFVSPILRPGRTYSFTFVTAGTFRYHDGLFPSRRGRVVVRTRPPPTMVTILTSRPIVTYGQAVRLSGFVSTVRANEVVSVFARRMGAVSFVEVATVLTGPGGSWAYDARPGVQTTYLARFREVVSGQVVVNVRPRVRLAATRTHLFASVRAARSFAGRFLVLQRLTARGTWVGVRRVKLGRRSGRLIRTPRRRGTAVYRAYFSRRQAGAGLLESWSEARTVRRR